MSEQNEKPRDPAYITGDQAKEMLSNAATSAAKAGIVGGPKAAAIAAAGSFAVDCVRHGLKHGFVAEDHDYSYDVS